MSKYDIYLQEGSNVLKNELGITDEAELDMAESGMVRTNMNLLYESGFSDLTAEGIKYQKYYTENYKPQPHEYIED